MNAGEMYPLFAAMLTSRPWEEVTRKTADHLYIPTNAQERKVLQQRAAMFSKEINEMLGKMPADLLLLLKTNDCLRSVDLSLGQVSRDFGISRYRLGWGVLHRTEVQCILLSNLHIDLVVCYLAKRQAKSMMSQTRHAFWHITAQAFHIKDLQACLISGLECRMRCKGSHQLQQAMPLGHGRCRIFWKQNLCVDHDVYLHADYRLFCAAR